MILNESNIFSLIDARLCAKQTTIAVVVNDGCAWIGSNWCTNPQSNCPRASLPTGVGYSICKKVCGQCNHAEADACEKAGINAVGATLYLIGHTYCCKECLVNMKRSGIKNIIVGRLPDYELEVIT